MVEAAEAAGERGAHIVYELGVRCFTAEPSALRSRACEERPQLTEAAGGELQLRDGLGAETQAKPAGQRIEHSALGFGAGDARTTDVGPAHAPWRLGSARWGTSSSLSVSLCVCV